MTENITTCMMQYHMLAVDSTKDLKVLKADGVVGLAPSAQRTRAKIFIDELYQANIIDSRVFSFYLANDWDNYPQSILEP